MIHNQADDVVDFVVPGSTDESRITPQVVQIDIFEDFGPQFGGRSTGFCCVIVFELEVP
jgi:hypothetical protein